MMSVIREVWFFCHLNKYECPNPSLMTLCVEFGNESLVDYGEEHLLKVHHNDHSSDQENSWTLSAQVS